MAHSAKHTQTFHHTCNLRDDGKPNLPVCVAALAHMFVLPTMTTTPTNEMCLLFLDFAIFLCFIFSTVSSMLNHIRLAQSTAPIQLVATEPLNEPMFVRARNEKNKRWTEQTTAYFLQKQKKKTNSNRQTQAHRVESNRRNHLFDGLDWECSDAKHKKNDSVRLSLSCDLQFAISSNKNALFFFCFILYRLPFYCLGLLFTVMPACMRFCIHNVDCNGNLSKRQIMQLRCTSSQCESLTLHRTSTMAICEWTAMALAKSKTNDFPHLTSNSIGFRAEHTLTTEKVYSQVLNLISNQVRNFSIVIAFGGCGMLELSLTGALICL